MPKDLVSQLEQKYLAQQLRDIVGNKLTLALTILNHLRDGKRVNRRLIKRAILDRRPVRKILAGLTWEGHNPQAI